MKNCNFSKKYFFQKLNFQIKIKKKYKNTKINIKKKP